MESFFPADITCEQPLRKTTEDVGLHLLSLRYKKESGLHLDLHLLDLIVGYNFVKHRDTV